MRLLRAQVITKLRHRRGGTVRREISSRTVCTSALYKKSSKENVPFTGLLFVFTLIIVLERYSKDTCHI